MKTGVGMMAAGLLACAGAPARAEQCMAASTDPRGETRHSWIEIDFARETRFDPAALPEGTVAIMCRRASIVPRPDDVRVPSEWRIPFGITQGGDRALWIGVRAGRLQVSVDGGKLSPAEKKAVKDWLDPANVRLVLESNRR